LYQRQRGIGADDFAKWHTIAQTGAWLDLHDIKDFYECAVITKYFTMGNQQLE